MQVRIKRIDNTLPLPAYQTTGAVAFDLYARERMEIAPKAIERIPTNVVVEVPKGYMLLVKDRSSTARKKGLLVFPGYVDQDYCGDGDEVLLQVYNFTDSPVVVDKEERIGQGAFVAIDTAEWTEVESMGEKNRGGFGSTG
ncbi:MAG TPA: dUTP diphosphatase [Candidatus Kapabacteria bacterium]|nr:dUTP diphosphatase [Candidatus Kapabacteria bacterium]